MASYGDKPFVAKQNTYSGTKQYGDMVFGGNDLPLPPGPFDSKQRAYKRRAYGSVEVVGNDQWTCSPSYTLTFGGDSGTKYAQGGALQPRSGGRYVPNPFLTSITTKNQGSGGIEDYSLWEVEFQYTCYGESQLNDVSNSFMIPGMLLKVIIGYDPGDRLIINDARVYDFSFSYNSDDGSYSCTTKCLGTNSAASIAGAVKVRAVGESYTGGGRGVVRNLMKKAAEILGVVVADDGRLSGTFPKQGTGKNVAEYGIINIVVPTGLMDWVLTLGSSDEMPVMMVQLDTVLKYLLEANQSAPSYFFAATYKPDTWFMSANPYEFLFPGAAGNYTENNKFDLDGTAGVVADIWISFPKLLQIEDNVLKEVKSQGGEYSINQLMNAIFTELSAATGGGIDCFITEGPFGQKAQHIYWILNKKWDVGPQTKGTIIKLLDPNSPVKSLSMSSNLDPDMAAIAFSANGGKYPKSMMNNIFGGGCNSKVNYLQYSDPEDVLKNKIKEIGEAWTPDNAQDAKGLLKEYVNQTWTGTSMRYGIDLSVTMDGYSAPKFMDRFYVQPLPSGVGGGDIYFAVGEIEHKCDGETWDTTIVGYMMVNT